MVHGVNCPSELVVGPNELSKPGKLKYTIKGMRFFAKIVPVDDN